MAGYGENDTPVESGGYGPNDVPVSGGYGPNDTPVGGIISGMAKPKGRSAMAAINDSVIEAGNAAAGLAKTIPDLIYPGSSVSGKIEEFIKGGQEKQSDWKKDQRARLQQDIASADGEFGKAGQYLKHAITEDPLGTVGQIAGNVGPFGVIGRATQGLSKGAQLATSMGVAGGVTAGEVRGNIFGEIESTPDADLIGKSPEYAALRQTMGETEAKREIGASLMRNLPEVAAAGAVGMLGGKYGLEGMAMKVAPGYGRLGGAVVGVADEATQGAVEQLAANYGVKRAIPEQGMWEDVALNAAAEGILGVGGALVASPREQAPIKPPGLIERAALKSQPLQEAMTPAAPAGNVATPEDLPAMAAEDVSIFAQQRMDEIMAKFSGTPDTVTIDPETGGEVVIPGRQPEIVTPQEKAEFDFLSQNIADPQTLAQAYGVQLAAQEANPQELAGQIPVQPTETDPAVAEQMRLIDELNARIPEQPVEPPKFSREMPNDDGAHEAATSPMNDLAEPTQGQIDSGTYKVGRQNVAGLNISVENPEGSTRRSHPDAEKQWENTVTDGHYGYIRGVPARAPDKEHVDVYVKPGTAEDHNGDVFVVNQIDPATGKFDEPKSMIGYSSAEEAKAAYMSNYEPGWKGFGDMTQVPMSDFKSMLQDKTAFMAPVKPVTATASPAFLRQSQSAYEAARDNIESSPLLTDEGLKGVETSAHDRVSKNADKMVAEYLERFGRVVDPDNVKRLFSEFELKPELAGAFHEPSSRLSKMIFAKALETNGNKPVMFTAGGGGSGKSETMNRMLKLNPDLGHGVVFDSTLSSAKSAIQKIDLALASGAPVDIVYTNREVGGALEFAMGRKRVVPLKALLDAHTGAAKTIRALALHYRNNPKVEIHVINNNGGIDEISAGKLADVPAYDYNQTKDRLNEQASAALKSGAISAETYAILNGGAVGRGTGSTEGSEQGQDAGGPGQGRRQEGLPGSEVAPKFARKKDVSDLKGRTFEETLARIPPKTRVVRSDIAKTDAGQRFSEIDKAEPGPGFLPLQKTSAKMVNARLQAAWNDAAAEAALPDDIKAKVTIPDAKVWDALFKLPAEVRYWYERSAEGFTTNFFDLPKNMVGRFIDAVAATSGNQKPLQNLKNTIAMISQDVRGEPVTVGLRDPASATKALSPEDLNTHKFGNFSNTMQLVAQTKNEKPLPTIDKQMSYFFSVPHVAVASDPRMYEALSLFVIKVRDMQNKALPAGAQKYESWQVQALAWVYQRGTSDPDDYGSVMPEILGQIRAAGIPLPNGKVSMETLMDERTAPMLSPTTKLSEARIATLETATRLTDNGVRAADLADKLAEINEPWARNAVKKYYDIQRQTMRALGNKQTIPGQKAKDPSLAEKLVTAVMGRKVAVSRIDTGAQGTFEGDASPNMRIPLIGSALIKGETVRLAPNDAQRGYVLAVLGKELNQAASAASEFRTVADGEQDTYSVFINDYTGDDMPLDVLVKLDTALGYPLNYQKVPNGWVVDINIGGFDTRPTAQQVADAVAAVMPDVDYHAIPRAYASDYIDSSEYDQIIKEFEDGIQRSIDAGGGKSARDSRQLSDLISVREAIRAVAAEQDAKFGRWLNDILPTFSRRRPDFKFSRRSDAAGDRRSGEGRDGVSYGNAQEGSTQVTGVHYSTQGRDVLYSGAHGTGMRGAERKRFELWSATPEQSKRIYFYVDEGAGIAPEDGVGRSDHVVRLNNLYDWIADPLKLQDKAVARRPLTQGDALNYYEQEIMAAGFDGYYSRGAQNMMVDGQQKKQGVAVLLGEHNVQMRKPRMSRKTETGNVASDGKANKAVKLLNQGMAKYLNDSAWENAYVTGELHDNLSAIGEAIEVGFGAKVFPIAPTAKRFDVFNGVHYAGNIYVNTKADVGFVNVAGHELFHELKRKRPDLYKWFVDNSRQYLKDFETYQNKLNSLLQAGEKKIDVAAAEEELMSDFTGDSLADPVFLQQLADASPTKFRQLAMAVRAWIDGAIAKLKGNKSERYVTDLQAMRDNLSKALVAFAEGKPIAASGTPGFAPNGKRSNLTDKQWHQVRTPEFKKWFGDWERHAKADNPVGSLWSDDNVSKVVDENGEPLVVYHGAKNGGFSILDPGKADSHRSPMVFAAKTMETARSYSGRGSEIELPRVPKTRQDLESDYGYEFDETEGGVDVTDGNGYTHGPYDNMAEAVAEMLDEAQSQSIDATGGRGVYSLFLNIRNPNEANFEGGNWDGARPWMYEVYDTEGEVAYTEDGREFMDFDDAKALAEKIGGTFEEASPNHETTNSVAEDALRYKHDGAIIRQVTDDGGQGGYVIPDDVYVFFDANQAKSATQNTGAFSQKRADIRFSQRSADGEFFSPLQRAFQNAKMQTMTGTGWSQWLKSNMPKLGVKKDEVTWSGINEYLELRGKDKISKEEVAGFLEQNGVSLGEEVRGGRSPVAVAKAEIAEKGAYKLPSGESIRPLRNGQYQLTDRVGAHIRDIYSLEDYFRQFADTSLGENTDTKFEEYVPDGGIPGTYREILVTLPPNPAKEETRYSEDGKPYKVMRKADNFDSNHWKGTPNVLVHLRVDEVKGDGNKRLMRVIEVQSDWGQEGKKVGFNSGPKVPKLEIVQDGKSFTVIRDGQAIVATSSRERAEAAVEREKAKLTGSVPSAPFVTDTKAWVALGIKRAIQQAVATDGIEGIVFATGQENADLYDLSKHIGSIEAKDYAGMTITINDKDGDYIEAKHFDSYKDPAIADYIGKEMAQKIADEAGNWHIGAGDFKRLYTGLDLKVGGEGMRAFYDQIVPSVAKDVMRQLGMPAELVGRTHLPGDQRAMAATTGKKWGVFIKDGYVDDVRYNTQREANEAASEYNRTHGRVMIDLTPALISTVNRDGIPLFVRRDEQTLTAAFKKWFGDSKVVDKDGAPLMVYHGTASDFDAFDPRERGRSSWSYDEQAFYFTAHPGIANSFAQMAEKEDAGGQNIMPVYLSLKNPFILERGDDGYGYDGNYDKNVFSSVIVDAIEAGHDGVIFKRVSDGGHTADQYAVFDPEQIKSAIGNNGAFDATSPDIRFSRKNKKPYDTPEDTKLEAARRQVQDKFLRFQTIQEAIELTTAKDGGYTGNDTHEARQYMLDKGIKNPITDETDVYQAESLMTSRISARKQDFREARIEPLLKKTAQAGVTMDEISDYLLASHAKEANARMRKIHKDPNATAFGMTDQEADANLTSFRAQPNFADLDSLANEWRQITEDTKRMLVTGGIISNEMANAWDATYSHYVPLKGVEDAQGSGKGLSVNGKQKRRMGHGAREEAIIANILRDYERAVTQVEKNKVGMILVRFALEIADDSLITIDRPVKRQVFKDGKAYEVLYHGSTVGVFSSPKDAKNFIAMDTVRSKRTQADYTVNMSTDPHVVMQASPMLGDDEANVYIAGQSVRIQLKDDLMAKAYTNMGVEGVNKILTGAREFNTWLSKAYTGYNPEFMLRNLFRDALQGTVTITGKFGAGTMGKVFTNYATAARELSRHYRNYGSSQIVNEARADGMQIGSSYLSDIERIGDDVMTAYNEYAGMANTYHRVYGEQLAMGSSKTKAQTIATMRSGIAGAKRTPIIGHILSLIEHMNAVVENSLRLATYKTLREQGVSRVQAAAAGKNLMNFNRKGEVSNQAGALYLFFNPTMQGTHVMLQALTTSKYKSQARALSGMMAVAAFALAELGRGGDDDDEEKWKKIPGYVRDRNLVFMIGDKQLTIPVPYGFGVFHSLGNAVSDFVHGESGWKLGVRMMGAFTGNFSPFGNPLAGDKEFSAFQLLPTIPKMALGPDQNENSFGAPIMPTKYSDAKPDSQNMYRTTKGTIHSAIAEGLNELTGGSKYKKGLVDVSPETLRFWVSSLTGGAGKFLTDTINLGAVTSQGAAPELREIPMARVLVREESIQDVRRAYWDRVNEAKQASEEFAAAKRARDGMAMREIMTDNRDLIRLAKFAGKQTEMIKAKRDLIDSIRNNDGLSLTQKRDQIKRVEDAEEEIYNKFISRFDTTTGD